MLCRQRGNRSVGQVATTEPRGAGVCVVQGLECEVRLKSIDLSREIAPFTAGELIQPRCRL